MFPDVAKAKSNSEHACQRLESCLQAALDSLNKESFDKLYESMRDRIEARIKHRGGIRNIKGNS